MTLSQVNKFAEHKVVEGKRYLFSVAFDVKPDLKKTERIDQEIRDILKISNDGGIAVILSHQGRQEYGDVRHLDFVARYLESKLRRGVVYLSDNSTDFAKRYVESMGPGDIVLLGNTRFNDGETTNDNELGRKFARLGDYAVIGGFTKAHRAHASNVGVLNYKSGFLARSCIEQLELLAPWVGINGRHSVAVLGGVKGEKVKAVEGFVKNYDYVIPGGIVLNTALKVLGRDVGDSLIEDSGKTFEKEIRKSLEIYSEKIHIPEKVMVARKRGNGFEDAQWISISGGVPEGFGIVDFSLNDEAKQNLEKAVRDNGRIVVAGTPGVYTKGFRNSTDEVMSYVRRNEQGSILLGGDTVNELEFAGTTSTGGGSALEYLCTGKLAVLEALRQNKERFQ